MREALAICHHCEHSVFGTVAYGKDGAPYHVECSRMPDEARADDLVKQARAAGRYETAKDRLINRLADRIEALEAEVKRLRRVGMRLAADAKDYAAVHELAEEDDHD